MKCVTAEVINCSSLPSEAETVTSCGVTSGSSPSPTSLVTVRMSISPSVAVTAADSQDTGNSGSGRLMEGHSFDERYGGLLLTRV